MVYIVHSHCFFSFHASFSDFSQLPTFPSALFLCIAGWTGGLEQFRGNNELAAALAPHIARAARTLMPTELVQAAQYPGSKEWQNHVKGRAFYPSHPAEAQVIDCCATSCLGESWYVAWRSDLQAELDSLDSDSKAAS